MPYIGNNHIAGDHTNNFKVLDDISSYTATFDGSATSVVDTTNNTIRVVEHRFIQGQRVTYTNGSGGNIGGLTTGTAYFVIFDSASTIKLATSASNAANSTAINLSAVGSGSSHTLNAAFDGVNTKFKLTHGGGTGARLNNATQINVAINNVVQRPNLDPNNFTDGFALEDNHKIVFQTAPTSEDIFWGSIIANTLTTFDISDHKIDTFTGDGSTTEFTLSHTPANNESLMVTINGVLQHPSNASTARAYTLIASIIQFTAAPGVGDEIQVRHMGFAGATTADVSGFYGRTGNVVLTSNDHITTGNINAGIVTATSFDGTFSSNIGGSNANFTGIVTAGTFKGGNIDAVDGAFSGNVTIGGTLTYEDVTNIDSVGIITAQKDIHVGAGLSVVGVSTLTGRIFAGGTSIPGYTGADDLTIGSESGNHGITIRTGATNAGGLFFSDATSAGDNSTQWAGGIEYNHSVGELRFYNGNNVTAMFKSGHFQPWSDSQYDIGTTSKRWRNVLSDHLNLSANATIAGDMDVDGHTNLDNVSVAGVTTFSAISNFDAQINVNSGYVNIQPTSNSATAAVLAIRNNTQSYPTIQQFSNTNAQSAIIQWNTTGQSGAGNFIFRTSLSGNEEFARFTKTGNFNLSKDLDVDGHTNLDNVSVAGVSTFSGIVAAGIGSTAITLDNSHKITLGSAHELEMFHDGSNSYIKQRFFAYPSSLNIISENSNINIMSGSGGNMHGGYENAITCQNNGPVKLYYGGILAYETTGYGGKVVGSLLINMGQLRIEDTIQHEGDTDTKIRFPSNDTISLETAGSERLRIDSSGRVLIGTTTEGHENADDLTIATSGTGGITIRTGTSNSGSIYFSDATSGTAEYAGFVGYSHANNSMIFGTNGAEKLRIMSNGYFGLGINSPSRRVHIHTTGSGSDYIQFTNDTTGTTSGDGYVFGINSDEDVIHNNLEATNMRFYTSGAERLRITSGGDLLLGNHGSRIFDDSSGTNVVVDIYGGTTAGKRGILALGGRTGSDDADIGTIQFLNENNANATSSSHVQSKLVASIDVKSQTTTNNSGANSGSHLIFSTKGENAALTERLRIDSSGNVGINSLAPNAPFDVHKVNGTIATFGDSRNSTFERIAIKNNVASYPAITNDSTHDTLDLRSMGSVQATIDSNNNDTGNYFRVMANGEGGAGTEIFRAQEDGKIGINDNSPATQLSVIHEGGGGSAYDVLTVGGAGHGNNTFPKIRFRTTTNSNTLGRIGIFDAGATNSYSGDFVVELNPGTNGNSTTERFRVTNYGDVNIGNGTGYSIWRTAANDSRCKFQFRQTTGDNRGFALLEERGDTNCMDLIISKSRGGNGVGVINSGDNLGIIKFSGADGTRQHNGAAILAWTSGTIATGRVPTNLSFYTAPDSVSSYLERLRIHSAGGIKFPTVPSTGNIIESGGSTVYANAAINLWRQGNGYCDLRLTSNYGVKISLAGANNNTDEFTLQQDNGKAAYVKNEANNHIYFQTGNSNTTRVAIRNSGAQMIDIYGEAAQNDATSGARGVDLSVSGHQSVPVYFGTETSVAQKSMYLSGYWIYLRGHVNEGIRFVFSQSSGAPHGSRFQFKYNQCLNSSNSTTWNTSSDGRAKENVQTITNGIEIIKKLRPVTYDWTNDYADSVSMYMMGKDENGGSVARKENGYDTDRKNGQYGFIAQEYETVLPKDVMKDKYTLGDAELDDFRTMTNDSLLPSLTAALKEAIAKIETLEAKVAALEGS